MRALRSCLVLLALVAGLFIAADRLAVHLAEEEAAERVTSSRGLAGAESASVTIKGFPFLTQVAAKELDEVEVDLTGMTAGAGDRRITVTHVDTLFTDVRLEDDFASATAERATGTAEISYDDLNAIAPSGVKVSYPGPEKADRNQVRLSASISVLGRTIEIPKPIISTVRVDGDHGVRLHAEDVPGSTIPGAEGEIRKRVDFGSDVRGLPSGLSLDAAEVTEEGVRFTLTGRDVRLVG